VLGRHPTTKTTQQHDTEPRTTKRWTPQPAQFKIC